MQYCVAQDTDRQSTHLLPMHRASNLNDLGQQHLAYTSEFHKHQYTPKLVFEGYFYADISLTRAYEENIKPFVAFGAAGDAITAMICTQQSTKLSLL